MENVFNISNKIKPPCSKYCLNRSQGCHSHCKEYKEYKYLLEQHKNIYKKEREIEYIICSKPSYKRK